MSQQLNFHAKDAIAANCQRVMDKLNLRNVPNLGMQDIFDGSVEYNWRNDRHDNRVLVSTYFYSISIHDKWTGKLLAVRCFTYDDPLGSIEYTKTSFGV